jgi:hypothetical protein
MSKIRDMADGDIGMFQKELGDTVTLTPAGGEPTEITAIPSEIEGAGNQGRDGNQLGHRRTWLIDPVDLPAPKDYEDTITIGTVIYMLDNHRNEGSWWRCEFTGTENIQRSSEKLHAGKT